MSEKAVKISTRVPTRKSLDGLCAAVGRVEGKPLVSPESEALPLRAGCHPHRGANVGLVCAG